MKTSTPTARPSSKTSSRYPSQLSSLVPARVEKRQRHHPPHLQGAHRSRQEPGRVSPPARAFSPVPRLQKRAPLRPRSQSQHLGHIPHHRRNRQQPRHQDLLRGLPNHPQGLRPQGRHAVPALQVRPSPPTLANSTSTKSRASSTSSPGPSSRARSRPSPRSSKTSSTLPPRNFSKSPA